MMDKLVLQHMAELENFLLLIIYGFVVFGALVAGITPPKKFALLRGPYFGYSGVLFLLIVIVQYIWLGIGPAIVGGYVWVLVSIQIIALVIAGYFLGVINMARSRDAFGHAWFASFGFVPIASFVLIFKRSKNINSAIMTGSMFKGGAGILTGVAAIIAGSIISQYQGAQMDQLVLTTVRNPTQDMTSILQSQGLNETLKQAAFGTQTHLMADKITTMLPLTADGSILRYEYEFAGHALQPSLQSLLIQKNCSGPNLGVVIDAGATIVHTYRRPDGSELLSVLIDKKSCASFNESNNLQNTLKKMAEGIQARRLDDVTIFLRAESAGTTFRYEYEFTGKVFPKLMWHQLTVNNCSTKILRDVIDIGATIEHSYHSPDGKEVATIVIAKDDCAKITQSAECVPDDGGSSGKPICE